MKQFEYKEMFTPNIKEINKLGLEGWELVAVDNGVSYFKRQTQ